VGEHSRNSIAFADLTFDKGTKSANSNQTLKVSANLVAGQSYRTVTFVSVGANAGLYDSRTSSASINLEFGGEHASLASVAIS
jgi:hypothetical protein